MHVDADILSGYYYRAFDLLVFYGQGTLSGVLFPHTMPLGIGYPFHSFVDALSYKV